MGLMTTSDHGHKKEESGSGGGFMDKLKKPFRELEDKLEGTHLHDAKVHLVHKKHQIGKLANLVRPFSSPLKLIQHGKLAAWSDQHN